MPLEVCDPPQDIGGKTDPTRIDIVAVPTVAVDPRTTFRYPGRYDPQWQSLYRDVRARVYLYSTIRKLANGEDPNSRLYDKIGPFVDPLESHDVEYYALDLLRCLSRFPNLGQRPLHFSGHGVGGLVVKKALVIAQSSSEESHQRIVTACFSVAFFGVPHFGSTVLSADEYRYGLRNVLKMESILPDEIRKELSTRDLHPLQQLNEKFASIALALMKIWTFVEGKKMMLQVLSGNAGEGETVESVWRHVVDPRSATLNSTAIRVGNEQVIELPCDHCRLTSFGNNDQSKAFAQFINELRILIEDLVLNEFRRRDPSWVEHLLPVDVHQFYEDREQATGTSVIKLWSETTNLSKLIQKGPAACLKDGIEDFESLDHTANGGVHKTRSDPKLHVPKIMVVPPEETDEDHRGSFDYTKTNVEYMDNMDGGSHNSQEEQNKPLKPGEESRSQENHNRQPITHIPDALLPLNWYHQKREFEKVSVQRIFQPPKLSQNLFRWIHVPTNIMLFVPRIFQAVGNEQQTPFAHSKLLDARVWDAKQNMPRHDSPHGRFMNPSCQIFLPTVTELGVQDGTTGPQLAVYFPYLHWDTFANLMSRSRVIERRMKQSQPFPIPKEIEAGNSIEHKLIWQYLNNYANLPLHHRRSLDQFGYPTLSSVSHRDVDQVLYKRTRLDLDDNRQGENKSDFMPHFMRLLKRDQRRFRRERKLAQQGLPHEHNHDRRAVSSFVDPSAKVVMVDQLWCWVLDPDTVITFFPAKEDDDNDPALRQGDLRDTIYNDINGDPRFSKQCENSFEFAALAICHAAEVFLDKVTDKDLQVFRIFEEYISELTERQTISFKAFRDSQADEIDDDRMLRKPLTTNREDLSALLELCDVEDELKTMQKLFVDQHIVLRQMMSAFREIDEAKLSNGISWLEDANEGVSEYSGQVNNMIENCRIAQQAYQSLLDMKQKQANVDEAWLARRANEVAATQGRAVMIFTIFTIIFLPLSFFTSLFGMNAREWSGVAQNLPLATIFILMASISFVVIVLALLIAFSNRIRDVVKFLAAQVMEFEVLYLLELVCWPRVWWLRRGERRRADLELGRRWFGDGEGVRMAVTASAFRDAGLVGRRKED